MYFTKNIRTVDFGLGVWSPMNKKEYGQWQLTISYKYKFCNLAGLWGIALRSILFEIPT